MPCLSPRVLGTCPFALPFPSVHAGPFPVQETNVRRNSSHVTCLNQSNEDGSSHGKSTRVEDTHCSPALTSALPLGSPRWAVKNNLLEKQASHPSMLHLFRQRYPILYYLYHCPGKREDSKASFLNTSVIPQGIKGWLKGWGFFSPPPHILDSSSHQGSFLFFFFFFPINLRLFSLMGAQVKIFCLNSDQFCIAFSNVKVLSYIILCFTLTANL